MRALDGSGLAKRGAAGRSAGVRRGPRAAALLGITLLCCLFGLAATASAAPAGAAAPVFSAQARQARAALAQAELTASNASQMSVFGWAVAVDGDTALVGAPGTGESIGVVYVFARVAGLWAQQQQLTAADAVTGTNFGSSVALVGDMALIGAVGDSGFGQEIPGAAYIFIRYGGLWTQRQKLSAADGATGDRFGATVALVGDKALVGAPYHAVGGRPSQGAAYVFVAARPVWVQEAELTAVDGVANDLFGCSVALSSNTALFFDTALVGARSHSVGGLPRAGAAYVFTRSPFTTPAWTVQVRLSATAGAAYDEFGVSVALDGDTALIGAPYRDLAGSGGTDAGAAYVFMRSGAYWAQQARLTPAEATAGLGKARFGSSGAVSGDTVLVGAPGYFHKHRIEAGGAWAFTRSGGVWTQQQKMNGGSLARPREKFGASVALSGDTALVGAPWRFLPAIEARAGAAFVFLTAPTIKSFKPASGPVGAGVAITGSFLTGATAVAFNGTPTTFIAFGSAITATVPSGATTGPITVTTPLGVATSATDFTVKR